jgi:hypothetical protein
MLLEAQKMESASPEIKSLLDIYSTYATCKEENSIVLVDIRIRFIEAPSVPQFVIFANVVEMEFIYKDRIGRRHAPSLSVIIQWGEEKVGSERSRRLFNMIYSL